MLFNQKSNFALFAFLPVALVATSASAAGVVSGVMANPDSSFDTSMSFTNDITSTLNISSLTLDGSTAVLPNLVWGGVNSVVAPTGATVSYSAFDTPSLTFNFGGDGWNPGEFFSVSLDPDIVGDTNYGARVSDLLGTRVTFNFSNSTSQIMQFIDDPVPNAGLKLAPLNVGGAVPEPSTWLSMIFGFAVLGGAIRRRSAVKVSYS